MGYLDVHGNDDRQLHGVRPRDLDVDQFAFEVLGDAAAWSTVEPSSVSLFPDAEETVQVRFRPPRTADLTAGPVPFAVKVTPNQTFEVVATRGVSQVRGASA